MARAMAEATNTPVSHVGLMSVYTTALVIAAPEPMAMYHHFGLKNLYVPNPTTKVSKATIPMKVPSHETSGNIAIGCDAPVK